MLSSPPFITAFSSEVQLLNTNSPISFTVPGTSIDVMPVQPENAYEPIPITVSGILISVNEAQPLKAPSSTVVTALGISRCPSGNFTSINSSFS